MKIYHEKDRDKWTALLRLVKAWVKDNFEDTLRQQSIETMEIHPVVRLFPKGFEAGMTAALFLVLEGVFELRELKQCGTSSET
jgi:hypothetical protein